MLPMFGNMSPKELRAMAKQLNAMASALEMSQDPKKFIEKKMKSQVSGVKRKMKNQIFKGMGF